MIILFLLIKKLDSFLVDLARLFLIDLMIDQVQFGLPLVQVESILLSENVCVSRSKLHFGHFYQRDVSDDFSWIFVKNANSNDSWENHLALVLHIAGVDSILEYSDYDFVDGCI